MKRFVFKYLFPFCIVGATAGIAFTILQGNTVNLAIPLTVGNRWDYELEGIEKHETFTVLRTASAKFRIDEQIGPLNFSVDVAGLADDGRAFHLGGVLTQTDTGILGNNLASFEQHAGKGFLLPRQLRLGQLFVADADSSTPGSPLVMRIERLNQSVSVPAGSFDDAMEISAAVEINEGRASGRFWLVPDVGVVKIEGTFSTTADTHGSAVIELTGFTVR